MGKRCASIGWIGKLAPLIVAELVAKYLYISLNILFVGNTIEILGEHARFGRHDVRAHELKHIAVALLRLYQ
jgi:hypothetical protein